MKSVLSVLRWVGSAREWLLLLSLAALAAGTYAHARRVAADRDAWASWGKQVCAFAGTTTDAAIVEVDTAKGKRKVAKARGQVCGEAVQDLAAYRARSQAATARVLGDAQAARAAKTNTDSGTAAANAADRRRAVTKMERLDAQLGDDDRVDGNYFAGINDLGGLR
ncbi:hypothetical protein OMP43_03905 [Sphingomonas sp. CBMAI 2297]|uniref:hypothetical protein n=1 Tax=Sphingomonas sp. CBMAI 2297 TaxID=2991720 RepID=UPI002457931B|nr:hypothetical protein [Sphingomonas sp. CBMAI 2297]MDH4743159.1 hypothetical protein [Sphingomonas sp. CBMAI 2297]